MSKFRCTDRLCGQSDCWRCNPDSAAALEREADIEAKAGDIEHLPEIIALCRTLSPPERLIVDKVIKEIATAKVDGRI